MLDQRPHVKAECPCLVSYSSALPGSWKHTEDLEVCHSKANPCVAPVP